MLLYAIVVHLLWGSILLNEEDLFPLYNCWRPWKACNEYSVNLLHPRPPIHNPSWIRIVVQFSVTTTLLQRIWHLPQPITFWHTLGKIFLCPISVPVDCSHCRQAAWREIQPGETSGRNEHLDPVFQLYMFHFAFSLYQFWWLNYCYNHLWNIF